ncbi:LacI family transcriptional regulator [Nocardioides albertanoniae]|uniref:LacI family transcriptional regulator n=1 Tax=Nocardioides albertanoniae TaxID=1175486 RepID=A0A543A335_9ACTN|nr:LacI family DNA-binding transcriptional regulator [Nocardioides albertanoniae]TQL66995.1 LacI family transcriptional regulator [Nocardioides albertanoniae]
MPTLDEVARLAGVSRATASRAVNGGSRVSARAAEAVAEAVNTLGYVPNPAARSLVTRRTETVAMIVPEPDERVFADPFFARTLHVATQVLSQRDLQVVLLIARPGDEMQRTLRYLRGGHVDGVIVVSHHRSDALADHLAAIGLPAAFIGRPLTGAEKVFYTDPDNVAGAREVTQILIERGCRRIGTITGPVDMSAGTDRAAGWRAALDAAGLATDAAIEGDFTEDGGEAACKALLRDHPDIDGLMVASDLMASGALRALGAAGLRVPDDVAVVGYDDLGIAERTTPPLTTVKNPISAMAEEAARLLLAQLDGTTTVPRRIVFAPELVRRTSA